MPHALINGARLWYDVMGEGEPLLLHHGFTASRVNWMPVAERLQAEYQVILMECRGTGESEDTADGYTLEQYALDVLGMMDHLGIDQFTYAGHSMGGGVGYVLATQHAERLKRLVLMAPIPAGGTTNLPDEDQIQARLDARDRGDREFFLKEYRAMQFREDVGEAWFQDRVDHLLRVSEGHLLGGMTSMHELNLAEQLPTISTPTLMLAGAVDGLLLSNLADYAALPNASLQVFSRAGHEVAVHEPDGVAEAIRQFMRHGPLSNALLQARLTESP